ncbi:site-specific integrase [Pseudidiomarina donghaiensis]|uniref:Site-specific integrase n=1 Tax=Pseudidiomarina donghaiensis TaxID=519452 RepID=A0A432XBZ4_9GAMM|nr:site-specific integrase [Pseudidiomarina donghaiensis]RUO46278.1 site-specific integrase [Pseudidiomarina donghaiensis]
MCNPPRKIGGITDEAQRLLNELPKHLWLMAQFSLATGLRQSNVSYLRWDQVDLERGFAWIHPDQSKSGKAINVPLNNDALSVLQEVQGDDVHYCFVYQGKPVERTSTKAWHAALKRAGIENFRWHDLRHTWASWHVQRGTSLQELQELGGWSSYEMVLRYAHLASHHLKRVAGNVDGTTGTNLVQSQKKRSPAISSEALSIMVRRRESKSFDKNLFLKIKINRNKKRVT